MAVKLQTLDPITIAVANTAYPLSSDHIAVAEVTIQAEFTNGSKILIGAANLSSTNALQIPPGDTGLIVGPNRSGFTEEFYLDEVFVTSTNAGDKVRVVAWRRSV